MTKKHRIRRSTRRLLADWIIITVILVLLAVIYSVNRQDDDLAGFARVVDGDTVRIDGLAIRLSGIDAPERRQRCNGPQGEYSCGKNASRHLAALIGKKAVICKGWQYDIYDRLLAVCHVAGENAQQNSLNARMVRDGWALSWSDYGREESAARSAKRGIWSGDFVIPANWRTSHGHRNDNEVAIVKSIWKGLKSLALKVLACCD